MSGKREKLAEEENVLKQKYQMLKKLQQEQARTAGAKKELTPEEKLAAAKKILAEKGGIAAPTHPSLPSVEKPSDKKLPVKFQRRLDNPEVAAQEEAVKKRRLEEAAAKEAAMAAAKTDTTEGHAPTPGRPGRKEETIKDPDGQEYYPSTIFIGDTPADTDENELEKHFSRFGPIETIRTLAGKNFGFVKFYTREAAQNAIKEMNGTVVAGVTVRVSRAKVPQPQQKWKSLDDPSFFDKDDKNYDQNNKDEKQKRGRGEGRGPRRNSDSTAPSGSDKAAAPQPPQDENVDGRRAVVYDDL